MALFFVFVSIAYFGEKQGVRKTLADSARKATSASVVITMDLISQAGALPTVDWTEGLNQPVHSPKRAISNKRLNKFLAQFADDGGMRVFSAANGR